MRVGTALSAPVGRWPGDAVLDAFRWIVGQADVQVGVPKRVQIASRQRVRSGPQNVRPELEADPVASLSSLLDDGPGNNEATVFKQASWRQQGIARPANPDWIEAAPRALALNALPRLRGRRHEAHRGRVV